ncbi:MAG: sugar phosphate isomerase/epimerase [Clostridia bacterium]|nr:sugar phosphate isomerase/epimerase [Clostridia bacterium]
MPRKLGVNFGCYGPLPIDEQVSLMKKNGFEAMFTGSEHPHLDAVMKAAKEAGITVDNYHAPFNKINDIWAPGEAGENMLDRLLVSVEKCAHYEVPALVVHLSSGLTPPYVNETGHDRFVRLMELASKLDVTICYENQRMLSNLAFAFETFPDKARFCWDCGHESCFTPGRHYMPLFMNKLSALHIHDNSGVFNSDDHMIPGDSRMDFDYVAEQISLSGYQGTLMLEILRKKTSYYDDWTPDMYFAHAAEAGRKLIDKIDSYSAK